MRLVALTMILHLVGSCRDLDSRRPMAYNLIKSNARSASSTITRRRLANVAKCKDFAEFKGALAFNFERLAVSDYWEPNCILLHCPEINGFRQLVNVSGVDYYSTYTSNTYTGNVSLNCIESIGLFLIFSERKNFSNARDSCRKVEGVLASVTSDARTRGLAQLTGDNLVFVGLSNERNSRAWHDEYGHRLSCYEYRAWDLGEPSHSRGCVGLVRMSHKSDPVWKVIPCSLELPFICEIPHAQQETQQQPATANGQRKL